MRSLLFPLAFALVFAGCVSAADDTVPVADGAAPQAPRVLPDAIEDSKSVRGVETTTAGGPLCGSPTSQCVRYSFDVATKLTIDAKLTWGVAGNDFDLHVFQDGVSISVDGNSAAPGTSEAFTMELEPGSYELVVVPWAAGPDTFTVTATFA